MILRGKVVNGFGEGSRYVSIYRDVFLKYLGIDPYPGTLNIELLEPPELPMEIVKPIEIPPPSPLYGKVLAVKAWIRGVEVYIVRPLRSRHPGRIIEVVSQYNLKEKLGVKTGDVVEILIE